MMEKLALDDEIKKVIREGVLKFGKISETYLMRKLKCDREKAKNIIQSTKHQCLDWDLLEIDCTMKEFECCLCNQT